MDENSMGQGIETVTQALEKFLAAAQPGAVFSEPVTSGEYTVITASEVAGGGGFGLGVGTAPTEAGPGEGSPAMQQGSGGGGGAGAFGRPVAVVVIGPAGVEIKPVIDASKLGLAGISAWIAILAGLFKMFGGRRG